MAKYIKMVDVTRCDGCRACMVACKNWNDLPAEPEEFQGSYQSHEHLTANVWNLITFKEQETADGGYEFLFRHAACLHCTDAACVKVCPEDALGHTEFGSVVVDYDKCVGCGYCTQACPFDVIQLANHVDENGKKYRRAQKCTLCTDRLENGLQPACVQACHTDCLVFGEEDEMLALAAERLEVAKKRFPKANIYNPQSINGTHTVYVLADEPEVYDLPSNPKVPVTATVWKDYAQPLGKLFMGATTFGVVSAFVASKLFSKKEEHEGEGDERHE